MQKKKDVDNDIVKLKIFPFLLRDRAKTWFSSLPKNVRSFMTLQFEHNNFFRNELKEQKSFMGYMNKELDDMSKEFDGLRSQIARLEKLSTEISDKQATLVNRMAAKPDFYENNDEDLKVIDVSHIKYLFCNMNLDNDGNGDEST